jgi:flavin reductase (DIM6/NTAB) family NADH-FMN oxidoreductase RutF
MRLDTATTDPVRVYQLLTGIVTPRPIAWVTTVSPAGVVNLAPFSFFNVFSANPPVVVFSPTLRRDRSKKDTLLNLERVPEFVVSAAAWSAVAAVNATSAELPPDDSEVSHAGLATTPSVHVRPPRVAGSPAALECRVRQIVPLGDGPIAGNLVLGDVLAIHVSDAVLDAAGRVDPRRLRTVARLGADFWCHTSDLFEQKRP